MTFTRSGAGEPTSFHRQVVQAAQDLEVKLVIIDTAADTFGGSENDRNQVRQYVQRALGQIALKTGGAVVCCAHPSREGLKSGEGDGGSTGWSNAFRSRAYCSAFLVGKINRRHGDKTRAGGYDRSFSASASIGPISLSPTSASSRAGLS